MDYKKIISDVGKYHFILLSGSKAAIIGSDDKTSDAKKIAEKFIKSKKGKFEELFVVRLKLQKILSKLLKLEKKQVQEGRHKTIGGPIKILIEFNQIKKNKIKKNKDCLLNNSIFITDKFLSKYKKITKKNLKTISIKTKNKKLNKILYILNLIYKFIK